MKSLLPGSRRNNKPSTDEALLLANPSPPPSPTALDESPEYVNSFEAHTHSTAIETSSVEFVEAYPQGQPPDEMGNCHDYEPPPPTIVTPTRIDSSPPSESEIASMPDASIHSNSNSSSRSRVGFWKKKLALRSPTVGDRLSKASSPKPPPRTIDSVESVVPASTLSTITQPETSAAFPPTSDFSLKGKTVVIVGGTEGIGFATAARVLQLGGKVVLLGATEKSVDEAASALVRADPIPNSRSIFKWAVAGSDEHSIAHVWEHMAETLTEIHHVVLATTTTNLGSSESPVRQLVLDTPYHEIQHQFDDTLGVPYMHARSAAPKLQDGGSLVFMSGATSRQPQGGAALRLAHAATECLTKALAAELGPRLRVNCLSPGPSEEERLVLVDGHATLSPAERAGEPGDFSHAICFLLTNGCMTGVVLDV